MPTLTRIAPAARQDVDVLFYGVVNERRRAILDALAAAGLVVKALPGIYGAERDAWIARSKLVLNVHYYDDKVHELVRTSYLLANRKAVVSECDDDTEIDADVREALVAVAYDKLVEACVALARDDARRHAIEQAGFEIFCRRNQAALLADLLPALSRPLPRRINLGSGKTFDPVRLNIDIDAKWQPDILGDISAPAGLRQIFFSPRFGLVRLEPGQFDEITTLDVLEHVPDLVALMTRCLDLLRVGGAMRIGVPYDLSWGAWQDPTHIRAFNERSWLYYTDWHWYLGWMQARFVMTELNMVFSPVGDALRARGVPNEDIFRTARAVDSMQVVLVKRALSDAERAQAIAYHQGPARAQGDLKSTDNPTS
jgi:SAM-dependent methyltransferase